MARAVFFCVLRACPQIAAKAGKAAMTDGRFVNRPYECQALYGAWQYERLFRHSLNSNYFQVWVGDVPQGRQPYSQRAQAEPSPERFQVLPAA